LGEDFTDDIAFETPDDFLFGFTFFGAFGNIGECGFMGSHAHDGDAVKRGVCLSGFLCQRDLLSLWPQAQ
jgi:hypothetical protein